MENIPPELTDEILQFVDTYTVYSCYGISNTFNVLSTKNLNWRKYKNQIIETLAFHQDLEGMRFLHETVNEGKLKKHLLIKHHKSVSELEIKVENPEDSVNRDDFESNSDFVKCMIEAQSRKFTTYVVNNFALDVSLHYGNLSMIKYLLKIGKTLNYKILNNAIRYGNLEIIKYLHDQECDKKVFEQVNVITIALKYDRIKVLDYLIESGYKANSSSVDEAAKKGYSKYVKLFLEKNVDPGYNAMNYAYQNNHMEIFQLLEQKGGLCAANAFCGFASL